MIDYKKYTFHLFIHLRLSSDQQKDWVHTDKSKYSFLTYLSETNYKSGTVLYDKINDDFYPHTEINFKQNRALLFKASEYHCSKFNHGDNINNGRLTLNAFLY